MQKCQVDLGLKLTNDINSEKAAWASGPSVFLSFLKNGRDETGLGGRIDRNTHELTEAFGSDFKGTNSKFFRIGQQDERFVQIVPRNSAGHPSDTIHAGEWRKPFRSKSSF